MDNAPRGWCEPTSEDYDIVSLSVEMSGEDVANLSAATGNHDAETCCHGRRLHERMIAHTFILRTC